MTRLIDAELLKKEIAKFQKEENERLHNPLWGSIGLNALNRLIDYAPTVEERPHGKWIEHLDYVGDTYYTCSHCGEDWITIEGKPTDNLMNYCPMCGADMREDGEQ